MSKLTIIYTYRDRDSDRVRRSLDSLKKQNNKAFKVIFIDYGSSSNAGRQVERLVREYDFVKYVYNDTRYRPWNRSHALNCGIRLSDTEFVFTADIDMIFNDNFVSVCYQIMDQKKAYFFSVYYLPKGYDLENIRTGNSAEKSKAYALGLGLINRQTLVDIGGYDELYCYWGKEDNDIEFRLRMQHTETVFYDDSVLLYHIYHDPVHQQRSLMPFNWISFQDSYFHFSKPLVNRNRGNDWGRIYPAGTRTSVQLIEETSTEFIHVDGRSDFFRYMLEHCFLRAEANVPVNIYYYENISAEFERSYLYKLLGALNKVFVILKLPVVVFSKYHVNYEDIYDARDHIAHFIATFKFMIEDFALEIKGNELRLVVIKKSSKSNQEIR